MMRCEGCTQLTQDSDFVEVVKVNGTVAEVCAWCASDMKRKKLAQILIQTPDDEERGLF